MQILVRHRTVVQAPYLHWQLLFRQPSDLDPTVHRRPINHHQGEAHGGRLRPRTRRVGGPRSPLVCRADGGVSGFGGDQDEADGGHRLGFGTNWEEASEFESFGFSTDGLATIAANCRKLRTLNLLDSEVEDLGGNWVSHFPESYTALGSLNVDILKSELPMSAMEQLVSNCGNLKLLRLNRSFPLEKLMILLSKAPELVDLDTGSFTLMTSTKKQQRHLATAFAEYCCTNTGLKNLSGLWDADPSCLPAIYPLCSGLTSLDLRNSTQLRSPHLVQLLRHCPNLQTLSISRSMYVLDYIEDRGHQEVATSCKKLHKLRVLFPNPYYAEPSINLTEQGLVSVVLGCPQLHHNMYFCNQMTNAALLTIANHNPNLTTLWLCINELLDHLTGQPLDDGYAAILERCEHLRSLAIAGPVTGLLEHIGTHGKRLEALWLIFAGQSDVGLHSILSGCNNLRKLWIRDSPFSGQVLLANADRLQRMRFLWMFSCNVGYRSCKHPRLNIEVVVCENNEPPSLHTTADDCLLENLYVYRTVAGPRLDIPAFVIYLPGRHIHITCLEFLMCVAAHEIGATLEGLVERSPNLKLISALPRLQWPTAAAALKHLQSSLPPLQRLNGLESLSGLLDVTPYYLPTIYPLCAALSSLDLSHSTLRCPHLVKLIRHCPNLMSLLVVDFIEDCGLEVVAASCKELQELRVLPSDPYDVDPTISITKQGLNFILLLPIDEFSLLDNRQAVTSLLIGTIEPQSVDYLTHQPLDSGFISIFERCKRLKRFWTTGIVTDRLLDKIGTSGKKLKVLGFTLCEGSDVGIHRVLSGCTNLRKLFIRECPFGGQAILANSDMLESIRCLWTLSCPVTYRTCKLLAQKHPRLNLEVIRQEYSGSSDHDEYCAVVEELYVYRKVAGPRPDMPSFVWNINQESDETGHGLRG
ncbi:hypothetical protein V2J09_002324 [Rumex salicifolius]